MATIDEGQVRADRVTELYRDPEGEIHEVPYMSAVPGDWRKVGENIDGRPRVDGRDGEFTNPDSPVDPAPEPEPSIRVPPRTGIVQVPATSAHVEIDPLLMDAAAHLRAAIALINGQMVTSRQMALVKTHAEEALLYALFGHLV